MQSILNNGVDSIINKNLLSYTVDTGSDSDVESENCVHYQEVIPTSPNHKQLSQQNIIAQHYKPNNTTLTIQAKTNSLDLKNSSPTVISLLSVPEICRQLRELRKQNEELRRKFDIAQKEKEDIQQRLERLEGALLLEKTKNFSDA